MKSVSILWNLGPDNTDCHTKNMSARLSMDHPPFGGQALQHQANFCSHAQGSIFIITFLLHHGNRALWRAAPKETGTKSRSGSAPGQTDRRRQRRRGRAPCIHSRSPGLLSKIPPPSPRTELRCRPSDHRRAVAAPCWGTLPFGSNHSLQLPL